MKIIQIALAALAFALTSTVTAQSLRNQLVGTWDFMVAEGPAHLHFRRPLLADPRGRCAEDRFQQTA